MNSTKQTNQPSYSEHDDTERDQLLAYAFRALGARALSETELRRKLSQRTENTELIEHILTRVQELGYQKDEDVARIENNRSGVGSFRVRQTLKRRGVSETLIEETLEHRDPDQEQTEAKRLLERRWSTFLRKKNPRNSAYAFLSRRGFSSSVIWKVLELLEIENGSLSSPPTSSNSEFNVADED